MKSRDYRTPRLMLEFRRATNHVFRRLEELDYEAMIRELLSIKKQFLAKTRGEPQIRRDICSGIANCLRLAASAKKQSLAEVERRFRAFCRYGFEDVGVKAEFYMGHAGELACRGQFDRAKRRLLNLEREVQALAGDAIRPDRRVRILKSLRAMQDRLEKWKQEAARAEHRG